MALSAEKVASPLSSAVRDIATHLTDPAACHGDVIGNHGNHSADDISIGVGSANEMSSDVGECDSSGAGDTTIRSMRLNDSKAGMDGLDVAKINQIITDASVGSKFYQHKQDSQRRHDKRVSQLRQLQQSFTAGQLDESRRQVVGIVEQLESGRDLSRWCVHVDMDAFYAAVEMRDKPELKNVPMAVGDSSMLSTSNYAARKYGVRAAMPGFIARKLCPHLVIVSANFDKYRAASRIVQSVLERYDPAMNMSMLDEAYLDITEYIAKQSARLQDRDIYKSGNMADGEENKMASDEECLVQGIVSGIRAEIFAATNLTASAGIACNGLLAKICSDRNKPDGQFFLRRSRSDILEFMSALPVRKVSGIGPVSSQLLEALGFQRCGQLLERSEQLLMLFSENYGRFLIRVSLGVAAAMNDKVDSSSTTRKSISSECTLSRPTSCSRQLLELLDSLCSQLAADLAAREMLAGVVAVKLKTDTFRVISRSEQLPQPTDECQQLLNCSRRLLRREVATRGGQQLWRLLGVRVSSLTPKITLYNKSAKQVRQCTLDALLSARSVSGASDADPVNIAAESGVRSQNCTEVRTCPLSPGNCEFQQTCTELQSSSTAVSVDLASDSVECPVCCHLVCSDCRSFNTHLDECLNKSLISALQTDCNAVVRGDDVLATTPVANTRTKRPTKRPSSCEVTRSTKTRRIDEYYHTK